MNSSLRKIEKILCAFIAWVYFGIVFGFIAAVLFGGRGGMALVILGVVGGVLIGIIRALYLGFKYFGYKYEVIFFTDTLGSRWAIVGRRLFFGFLYLVAIYTYAINYFYPVEW